MYEIEFSRTVQRVIASDEIPLKVIDSALMFIRGPLARNPYRVGGALRKPPLAGKHRAARRDFRIIYSIDDARHAVMIEDICHRSDAYY